MHYVLIPFYSSALLLLLLLPLGRRHNVVRLDQRSQAVFFCVFFFFVLQPIS